MSARARRRSVTVRLALLLAAAGLVWLLTSLGPLALGTSGPLGPDVALAAEPSPSAPGGDLRSSGEGAGAAGQPMGAVEATIAVLLLGLGTAAATMVYVRLTRPGRERR